MEVRGATPDGVLRFQLPAVNVTATYVLDDGSEQFLAPLDTVLIEPDAGRVVLVWRAVVASDKKTMRVREDTPTVTSDA